MKQYKRLDTVIKLAEKKEEEASQEVKKVSAQLEQENIRLQDLQAYHQEYQKKIYDLQNQPTSVNDVQTCLCRFLIPFTTQKPFLLQNLDD